MDWPGFVEAQSAVERVLREDPAGVYGRMDVDSRSHYRRIVELLAQHSAKSEMEVARSAIALARNAYRSWTAARPSSAMPENLSENSGDTLTDLAPNDGFRTGSREPTRCHVGYYLMNEGRTALEEDVGYRRTWRDSLAGIAARAPLRLYLGGVAGVWLLVVAAAATGWEMQLGRIDGSWFSLIIFVFLAGAASQFAVSVVNWLCTLVVPTAAAHETRFLPRNSRRVSHVSGCSFAAVK